VPLGSTVRSVRLQAPRSLKPPLRRGSRVAPLGYRRGSWRREDLWVDAEDPSAIGARARRIRTRRGLSLDVAAGLAGISKPYLSALERGKRGFNRRGLIEDLANALGCSVVDLPSKPP